MPTPVLVSATVVSAMALAFALPNDAAPYGVPLLGLVCLAPYFAAVSRTASYRSAAVLGAVFGALAHALSSYWLYYFQDFAFWTLGSTSIAYGLLYALVAVFLRRFSLRDVPAALRPFLVAAVWTVWEWAKSTGFLGYPWGLVAYAASELNALVQSADSFGVYGLSFLLALSSALAAEFASAPWRPARFRPAPFRSFFPLPPLASGFAVLAVLALWFGVYGVYRLSNPTPVADTVPMVLVQHNGDSWAQGGEAAALRTAQRLSREGARWLAAEGKRPALVAWSETVLRRPFDDYKPYFRKNPAKDPLIPFLAELGVPLLTGAPVVLDWERYDATNSAVLLSPQGTILSSYAKMHPVPFAESIPFWEYRWMRDFMSEVVGLDGGWVMGTEATVMEVPTASGRPLRFGVPICFEDAFPSVCAAFLRNGADILVNITNDSWSLTVSAETQHFVAARFRAIEFRRVLVRSTNGGVTAVVDAEGRTLAQLPLFTEAVLPVEVPVQIGAPTTYFLLGDWFPALLAIALFLVLLRERLDER